MNNSKMSLKQKILPNNQNIPLKIPSKTKKPKKNYLLKKYSELNQII